MADGTAIALIPARAGSERIPRKNIAPFFGHPMIAYTIAAARLVTAFDEVIVSTDGPEIASIARHYGARVVDRPAGLADPQAGLVPVSLHAVDQLVEEGEPRPSAICLLMPNCPLRGAAAIRSHLEAFEADDRRFQLSVTEYVGAYPDWAMTRATDGRIEARFGKFWQGRSQELPPSVCPSGAIWIAKESALREQMTFYGAPLHGECLGPIEAFDIDDQSELEYAAVLVEGCRARGTDPLTDPEAHSPD